MRTRLLQVAATLALATFAITATAGAAPRSTAQREPIKLGAVAQLTGLAFAVDVPRVAAAVFSEINRSGGINGRRIADSAKDDGGNPQRTAQVARELVDSEGVVALVGSVAFNDCPVNAGYYVEKNVVSVQGVGVFPQCFGSPNIAPVNTGPFIPMLNMLYWASEIRKKRRVCITFTNVPGASEAWKAVVADWTRITGKRLALYDDTLGPDVDWTPVMLRAKAAGCDAIIYNGAENAAIPILRAAQTQGMRNVDFLFFPPTYTLSFARAAKDINLNIFVASEFEPFTLRNKANQRWRAFLKRNNLPVTNFGQGGYLAALFTVQVLRSIKGEINRASVTRAFKTMKPIRHPMLGTPWVFGPGDRHQPNDSVKMVQLVNGQYKVASGFIRVPKKK